MTADDVELVREAWEAARRGDLDAVASLLAPDVRWHGLDDPESGCHGCDEAVDFVRRSLENGVVAEATDVRSVGDRVVVTVHVHHPPERGEEPEPHGEVVTVRGGEIAEIIVFQSAAEAVRAVGRQDSAA